MVCRVYLQVIWTVFLFHFAVYSPNSLLEIFEKRWLKSPVEQEFYLKYDYWFGAIHDNVLLENGAGYEGHTLPPPPLNATEMPSGMGC